MQRLDFQDALDRFGDDLSRWPAAERVLGEAMLRDDPTARRLIEDARLLKSLITTTSTIRAPAGLADRIVSLARETAPALPHVASPPTAAVDRAPRGRLDTAVPHRLRRPG
ncbi:hypothetical protein ACJ4V0_20500 [Phreatobacter sp. HK31-P]